MECRQEGKRRGGSEAQRTHPNPLRLCGSAPLPLPNAPIPITKKGTGAMPIPSYFLRRSRSIHVRRNVRPKLLDVRDLQLVTQRQLEMHGKPVRERAAAIARQLELT